jgi:two-component system chemotaxis response regulator CheY
MPIASIANYAKRNVLIVEDDEDDVFLLRRAMNIVSMQDNIEVNVTHMANGLHAISAVVVEDLKSHNYDILIVDLNMPIMDGLRFLHILREEFRFSTTRAVMLTTSNQPPIHAAARKAGADDVFVKGDVHDDLVNIVRKILVVD